MRGMTYLFLFLLLVIPCSGATITVNWDGSGDYTTIQAAINDANDFDTVIVADGTYTGSGNRNLDFGGKAITVRSTEPNNPAVVAATIIDCQGSSRGFYFHSGETSASILSGVTIYDGYVDGRGGGIYCYQSNPTIRNCKIWDNRGDDGGGINCHHYSSPTIENCLILNNTAYDGRDGYGGGICCDYYSSPVIRNCVIKGNNCYSNSGGGISCLYKCKPKIRNCTIVNNDAEDYAGGIFISNSVQGSPTVQNCIVWNNTAWRPNPEIAVYYGGAIPVSYSDVKDGYPGTGNINSNPSFEADSYHLSAGSPCIEAGNPAYTPVQDEKDIDNEWRIMGGIIDMGADEFTSTPPPIIYLSSNELDFSSIKNISNPPDQTFSVRNTGGGTLDWTITESCSWLTLNPNSGSSTGEPHRQGQ